MFGFCPQDIGQKEKGRAVQCRISGLSYKEAAPYFMDATPKNFQVRYNAFVQAHPEPAKNISDYRSSGIGPGEMVAYFLFNNVTIGGQNATCDLSIDLKPFAEMKGGVYSNPTSSIYDFKLSKDHHPSVSYITENVASKVKNPVDRSSHEQNVVNTWKDMVYVENVVDKQFALVQNDTLFMRFFGHLTKDMIELYRIHRNQPWARVYLPKVP